MKKDPIIQQVVGQICAYFDPKKILLFSYKTNLKEQLVSFKLVVIADGDTDIEHDIYLQVDCEIPFDVVVYSSQNWNKMIDQPQSFAARVDQKGVVLYG